MTAPAAASPAVAAVHARVAAWPPRWRSHFRVVRARLNEEDTLISVRDGALADVELDMALIEASTVRSAVGTGDPLPTTRLTNALGQQHVRGLEARVERCPSGASRAGPLPHNGSSRP